jgi:AcrR family transcriptional regulator
VITQREKTYIRQKQIISAARKLIVKYGSERVTLRRMAKEIGVSEGAIYRHFKSKNDILSFLIDDIRDTLVEDVEQKFTGKVGSLETLENIINKHISSIEQKKGVSFQVIAEIISFGDKKLNKKIYSVIDNYIFLIKEILKSGIDEGVIRPDIDLEVWATLFFSMTQGLVNIWALSQYSFNLQERFKPLWDAFRESIVKN